MAILEKEVWAGLNSKNLGHFEKLGYMIPRRVDNYGKLTLPRGSLIKVKTAHLPRGSNTRVTKICDNEKCQMQRENVRFVDVMLSREKNSGKDFCNHCSKILGIEKKHLMSHLINHLNTTV